jgi:hypothetical protein
MSRFWSLLLPFLLLLASCQKDELPTPPTPQPAPNPPSQLKIDSTKLKLSGTKSAIDSFTIQYTGDWSIAISPTSVTWIKTDKTSGTGNAKVYVTAEQDNISGKDKTANITVTPNGETANALTIVVTQIPYIPVFKDVWSKVYGGSGDDVLPSLIKTTDGGYIMAGKNESNDGDVSANKGSGDVWVVKINADGNKQWEKSYGGSNFERGATIVESKDGGYYVAAQARSTDGDVTGNKGSADMWVLKISLTGNLIWQKTLGGSQFEIFTDHNIVSSTDGGCVLISSTLSNDGDVTGNHGDIDIWAVKLNSDGSTAWKKTYGGSNWDEAYAIANGADGGFVIAGMTYSNNGDVSGKHGTNGSTSDAWVIKIDESGSIVWTKAFGGNGYEFAYGITATSDNGYIIVGTANFNDGDVSGVHAGQGNDIWVVKMDGMGNIQWQKALGGSADESAGSIVTMADGYILTGTTQSNDSDVTSNLGGSDAWIAKIDTNGQLSWQKSVGGSGEDAGRTILLTDDGNYILSGQTGSNDGDISGNNGKVDGWAMKFRY